MNWRLIPVLVLFGCNTFGDLSEPDPLACVTYCDLVDQNCLGDNILYENRDFPDINERGSCEEACNKFANDVEAAGADAGDTVQCRIEHLTRAANGPSTHCPHGLPESAVCF